MYEEERIDVGLIRQQVEIERIRDRSRILFSEYRRRTYEGDLAAQRDSVQLHPEYDPAPMRPPEEFAAEDALRDRNMITSGDILDMYLAELADYKNGFIGFHSRRTEKAAQKVSLGLHWAIEFDERRKKVYAASEQTLDMIADLKTGLMNMDTASTITGIHRLLDFFHVKAPIVGYHMPVRDLYWESPREIVLYLDFLSNGLR